MPRAFQNSTPAGQVTGTFFYGLPPTGPGLAGVWIACGPGCLLSLPHWTIEGPWGTGDSEGVKADISGESVRCCDCWLGGGHADKEVGVTPSHEV